MSKNINVMMIKCFNMCVNVYLCIDSYILNLCRQYVLEMLQLMDA